MSFATSPLIGEDQGRGDRAGRLLLFACWCVLAGWLWWTHVVWRDEVRAFSLALSGSNLPQMLRAVHGEGHPALWYLILRGAHDLFPYREVLPFAGAVFGVAAMAMVAFVSPFRLWVVAMVLFSGYGAFEYVAIARNYGIAALVMLGLAAVYGRVRNSLWFGAILILLCNTNVPACLLAAGFLLFRFVELFSSGTAPTRRELMLFAGNAVLAAIGALLCFVTVYPTFNDAALSSNAGHFGLGSLLAALVDDRRGFSHMVLGPAALAISCLAFVRRPAALAAAIFGLIALKLFFYFIYGSLYRHEVLYLFFLLSLFWMTAQAAGGSWRERRWMGLLQLCGAWAFVAVLAASTVVLLSPVHEQLEGKPYSRSADVAKLLQRPDLSGAIVMADPDTMLETLPYYVDNPLWMLRQQRFGKVTRLSENARHDLTLDDVLADAQRLHAQTGRPIVFLSHVPLQSVRPERTPVMFDYSTIMTPDSVRRFRAATRQIASLRGLEIGDEAYDVFVYPR